MDLEIMVSIILAVATVLLAIATVAMAYYSWKVHKSNQDFLREGRLFKEMDQLIELIASKIGKLKEFEPLHVKPENIKEASEFRELIKKNKYLAPKDLQILISKYLAALDEYEKDLSSARYDLKMNLPAEMMLYFDAPLPVKEGEGSYKTNIENILEHLDDEDKHKRIAHFRNVINKDIFDIRIDGNLTKVSLNSVRFDLERAIEKRNKELGERISAVMDH
ncbi:MAG: hypothetical protein ACYDHX_13025 [Methanothrix sp.]